MFSRYLLIISPSPLKGEGWGGGDKKLCELCGEIRKEAMVMEENVFFYSDSLKLEGSLSYDQDLLQSPGAILCPPHPHLGGDMDNNVITKLHHFLPTQGIISLRFNYRGVGNSQTSGGNEKEDLKTFWEDSWTPDDEVKVQDVMSAIDFLRGIRGVIHDQIILVGYSFGAYLALQAAAKCSMVKALILIAPTIHFHDFTPLNVSSIPKFVISSDNDFSYSLEELKRIYADFSQPKTLQIFEGVDHFFIGCEGEVSKKVAQFMLEQLGKGVPCG